MEGNAERYNKNCKEVKRLSVGSSGEKISEYSVTSVCKQENRVVRDQEEGNKTKFWEEETVCERQNNLVTSSLPGVCIFKITSRFYKIA
jgi:hypothetical protein